MSSLQSYLETVESRVEKATPGPWLETNVINQDGEVEYMQVGTEEDIVCTVDELVEENQEFIAHARQDIPTLISICRELREALEGIAFSHKPDAEQPEFWKKETFEGLVNVVVGDTLAARHALARAGEICPKGAVE